jgi:hypothetical protein
MELADRTLVAGNLSRNDKRWMGKLPMNQSTKITGFIVAAFVIFITIHGELPTYLGFLIGGKSPNAASGKLGGGNVASALSGALSSGSALTALLGAT